MKGHKSPEQEMQLSRTGQNPENGKQTGQARGRGGEGKALNKADFSRVVLLHKTRDRRIE